MENIKLSEELETQKSNLRDINEFLTNELKARLLTTTDLEGKIAEMEKKHSTEKAQYKVLAHVHID